MGGAGRPFAGRGSLAETYTPRLAAVDRPGGIKVKRRTDLSKMAKIEVVVPGSEAPAVREIFKASEVTGFTSVSGVSGLGHGGYHQGRLLFNDQATLEMLITVVPFEKIDSLLAGLRPLLEESSGVMFLSDTYVSRPEYFT